ncbi:hypothetical protein Bca52824_083770 [Brassica carinata]|uniref:Uncharacterized protein n=1 Tax=Brassica carinata TaxID=52824 RepID=A0A8X7TTY3_BRACI|nr:hypothetical protein Bca52824_083770 [Brassica carinata]
MAKALMLECEVQRLTFEWDVCAVRELRSSEQEIGSQVFLPKTCYVIKKLLGGISILVCVSASMETESFQDVVSVIAYASMRGNRRVAKTNYRIELWSSLRGFPIAMKSWMGTSESLPSHVRRTMSVRCVLTGSPKGKLYKGSSVGSGSGSDPKETTVRIKMRSMRSEKIKFLVLELGHAKEHRSRENQTIRSIDETGWNRVPKEETESICDCDRRWSLLTKLDGFEKESGLVIRDKLVNVWTDLYTLDGTETELNMN